MHKKIVSHHWVFSVIKVDALIWGDHNNSGKTNSVFKIKHILIIPTKCTIYIRYIHLLYLSYMLRYYIHHQGELLCPLLKTIFCYVAFSSAFYSSDVVNYKRYNSACTGVTVL
jgi:hypothetical protein